MMRLPEGWVLCDIGDVLDHVEMIGKDEKDRQIQYIDISSIDNKSNRIRTPKRMNLSEAPSRARQKIRSEDILFSTVRPYLRKIAAVDQEFDGEIASTGFAVLRAVKGIEPRYLFYKCVSHDFVSALTGEQYGVSYPAVKEEQVTTQPLELPPTDEQRRIVERIEALCDEIDQGVKSLRAAKHTLDLYRKSLLKSAFEGRLTVKWRQRSPDKLEDPEAFLARIRKDRELRHQAAIDEWEKAVADWKKHGGKGKRPARPKKLSTLSDVTESHRYTSTPHEWIWLPLAGLGTVTGGLTKSQSRSSLPLKAKYLRVANVYANRLELDEIKEIGVTQDELRRTRLLPGDLLFVEGNGSIDQIGRVALWDGGIEDVTHQNHLIRCSTGRFLLERFALLFFMSPAGRELITAQASSTSGLHTLSISKVEALPVPICTLDEQAEIIRLIDLGLSASDLLEKEINASLVRADALRQSILKKAFAGELVSQDPNDEPASALLERIRTGWTKAPTRRRTQ